MSKIFLLADDDHDDTELFQEALGQIDPTIVCYHAPDGGKALEILADTALQQPQIIFLDVNMPGMNGWECLRELKSSEAYQDIPVLMYSTSSHQKEADKALTMGALCFISKPHSFGELKNILQVTATHLHGDLQAAINNLKGAICR